MRHRVWVLGSIMLLALLLRVAFVLLISHPELRTGDWQFTGDEADYHGIAAALATTGQYSDVPQGRPTAYRTPGFVLPLALIYYLAGVRPFLGVVLNVILGTLIVGSIGLVAHQTFRAPIAVAAAMLVAAAVPSFVQNSAALTSDSLAVLCTFMMLAWLIRWHRQGQVGSALAAGGWFAWSFLTRASIGFALPLLAAWMLWSRPKGATTRGLAAFCLVFAAIVLPWVVRNELVMGDAYPGGTVTGWNLWQTNNPVTAGLQPVYVQRDGKTVQLPREWLLGGDLRGEYAAQLPGYELLTGRSETEVNAIALRLVKTFAAEHPGALAMLMAHKLLRFLSGKPIKPPWEDSHSGLRSMAARGERWLILLFGGIGLALLFRRDRALAWLMMCPLSASLLFVLVSYPNARFFMVGTGVLIITASGLCSRTPLASEARQADPVQAAL